MSRTATVLAVLTGAAFTFFGLNFLLNGAGAASGFGISPWPEGNAAGYFVVKGVRDLALGATAFTLLALGQRRALGWVVLADVLVPAGDAAAVLGNGGSVAVALGVHASAAAVVLLTAVLLLVEQARRRRSVA
ncbi:DUF4267 domain-containing protein [Streptomyces sp. NPDC019890]|uniref:DUF4267 domain-containing protein n=1 Tax=Streptomyces sp. NPDC019890 TaxID=3365064 RepID=UPI00384D4182